MPSVSQFEDRRRHLAPFTRAAAAQARRVGRSTTRWRRKTRSRCPPRRRPPPAPPTPRRAAPMTTASPPRTASSGGAPRPTNPSSWATTDPATTTCEAAAAAAGGARHWPRQPPGRGISPRASTPTTHRSSKSNTHTISLIHDPEDPSSVTTTRATV